MKKPPKLTPSQLVHPKAPEKSRFNGDVLRKEESFNDRVSVVHGTTQNTAKERIVSRQLQPMPGGHAYARHRRMDKPVPKPLTDRQKRQLRGK